MDVSTEETKVRASLFRCLINPYGRWSLSVLGYLHFSIKGKSPLSVKQLALAAAPSAGQLL